MRQDYSEAEQEHFEERAAIAEYLAGYPRAIAESEASRAVGHARWINGARGSPGWIEPPRAEL